MYERICSGVEQCFLYVSLLLTVLLQLYLVIVSFVCAVACGNMFMRLRLDNYLCLFVKLLLRGEVITVVEMMLLLSVCLLNGQRSICFCYCGI